MPFSVNIDIFDILVLAAGICLIGILTYKAISKIEINKYKEMHNCQVIKENK